MTDQTTTDRRTTDTQFKLNAELAPSRFITTPIFYANGEPHLGHAYSGIIGDALHRFGTLRGDASCLITGTDEHGQKIANAAAKKGAETKAFVDTLSQSFQTLWPQLSIEPSEFVRTTDSDHRAHIERIWTTLERQGDITLGSYAGDYCVACEQYYPQRELIDGLCPVHKTPISKVEEETYLFNLERYRHELIAYYEANPGVVQPAHFQQSLIEQLRFGSLEALSISRVNNQWGIAVPSNDSHTVYVWLDALFSYITAIERSGAQREKVADTIHVIGKDILQFHGIYWPIFLLALGLPLPKKLLVHGWWTIEGEKISKSNPATTVRPQQFANKLTVDGLRYALLRQKPLHRDGNVQLDDFAELINAELVNNLANLVKRTNTLVVKHFDGRIDPVEKASLETECAEALAGYETQLHTVVEAYQRCDLYEVTKTLSVLTSELNSFFHHREPWLIRKGQVPVITQQTLLVVGSVIRELAWLLSPIAPALSQNILEELDNKPSTLLATGHLSLSDYVALSANSHWKRV